MTRAGFVMAELKPQPTKIRRWINGPKGLTSVPTNAVGTGRELQNQKRRAGRMSALQRHGEKCHWEAERSWVRFLLVAFGDDDLVAHGDGAEVL